MGIFNWLFGEKTPSRTCCGGHCQASLPLIKEELPDATEEEGDTLKEQPKKTVANELMSLEFRADELENNNSSGHSGNCCGGHH